MKWIKDEDFIRGKVPMTKYNVRVLTMAYLEIDQGDKFLDIGAGTGSISIEAAAQGADVVAIETVSEGVELIKKNRDKFNLKLDIIEGKAPYDLPDTKFNKVFIGGSRGELSSIFQYLDQNLEVEGILVANFIMLSNLEKFRNLMKKYNYKNIETHMIQASSLDKLGLLKGQNPIFIVKGVKE